MIMTVNELALLVKQLRAVQKASGSGYKTPAGGNQAKALEVKVDAAIQAVLHPKPPWRPREA